MTNPTMRNAQAMLISSPKDSHPPSALDSARLEPLDDGHKEEVLRFLGTRPVYTFIMSSWIRDNGLASSLNRGTFYGCRNAQGQLDGVALIGHTTLFETENNTALAAFARLTKTCPSAHVVLGRAERVDRFLGYYMHGPVKPRMVCYELLFQKNLSANVETVTSLRPATSEELELVVPIHALTAFEESGLNPLERDPAGFRERCARRIQQGRVWLAIENGKLKFKADVVSETPEVVYLEGVYVDPVHRGNGYGSRCMTQLTNHLLERTKSVCLLVNQSNWAAQVCYRKAGFEFHEYYDTIYLHQQIVN